MRCSTTALVLATVAAGQVAAGAIRHANFHARRNAEPQGKVEIDVGKRDLTDVDWNAIDWAKVVDWSTISYTYSSGQTWGSSTAVPVVAPSSAPATTLATSIVVAAAVVSVTPTPTPTPVVASYAPPASSSPAAAATSKAATNIVSEILADIDAKKLISLGLTAVGINSKTNNGGVWIGTDGPYTNEFSNNSGEDLILVCWGSAGSWVNAVVPQITISIASGSKQTLSFASGSSGACSAIYKDTVLVNGQISNTWLEITTGEYGVFDVSREVNMNGHSIEAVGPKCTSNMSTCVFVCDSGTSCLTGYTLKNCANGSQPGANYGQFDGADSGGCGGLGSSAHIKTSLS